MKSNQKVFEAHPPFIKCSVRRLETSHAYIFFGFKMFLNFFTMNLAVKIFSIFFTMNLAVKIFRIFFYNEFGCKNFLNFFYNEFGCKNFSNFFYTRVSTSFFLSSKMKSHLTCLRPHIWSACFFQGQDGLFFKVFPTSEESHLKLFQAYLVSWKRFEAIWDHMFLWSLCDDTWKSCFAQIFMKNLTVKKIRTFFYTEFACKIFLSFFLHWI